MARVTVEDCVGLVPNRFELVLLAAQRARDIRSGADLTVEKDNDKNAVIALREIAEETIDLDTLRHELEHGREVDTEIDEPDEDSMAVLAAEAAWAGVTGQTPPVEEEAAAPVEEEAAAPDAEEAAAPIEEEAAAPDAEGEPAEEPAIEAEAVAETAAETEE